MARAPGLRAVSRLVSRPFLAMLGIIGNALAPDSVRKPPRIAADRDAHEAILDGKDQIVAGLFKNKAQSSLAHVPPDTAMAEIHRKKSDPGSARK